MTVHWYELLMYATNSILLEDYVYHYIARLHGSSDMNYFIFCLSQLLHTKYIIRYDDIIMIR